MYTIHNYSIDDNYTYSNTGTNTSHVITAMIHLAGRLCEHYASDIVYDANAFIEAVDNNKDFDRYLFFRENGVTAFAPDMIEHIEGTDFIQAWHLTYNAETQEQEFTRVSIRFERRWN